VTETENDSPLSVRLASDETTTSLGIWLAQGGKGCLLMAIAMGRSTHSFRERHTYVHTGMLVCTVGAVEPNRLAQLVYLQRLELDDWPVGDQYLPQSPQRSCDQPSPLSKGSQGLLLWKLWQRTKRRVSPTSNAEGKKTWR